jgi:crotonobetainyl-CoA:carnitine CoA-transferase CaiB-like acyl-CoA transferase
MTKLATALSDITVLDLGVGLAAALVAKFLAQAGAEVVRLEPPGGDPFADLYPAHRVWRARASTEQIAGPKDKRVLELLSKADVCICGGEDYPGLEWRFDAATMQAGHPRLVVLDLSAYPPGHPSPGPAAEVLLQAASGIAFEHYAERPLFWAFQPASYGAALQALVGVLAALYSRGRDDRGQRVSVSLYEGALTWALGFWHDASEPKAAFHVEIPKDPCPLIFCCRDGEYIQLVMGSAGSKGRLYRLLEIDDPSVGPNDSGVPTLAHGPRKFWGDVDVLAPHIARHDSGPLLERLWAANIGADRILEPGANWDDPQVRNNGIIDTAPDGSRLVGLPLRGGLRGDSAALPGAVGTARGPLSGIRVLDFGIVVAGPVAAVPLADLGAEVIKIEAIELEHFRSVYRIFASANRGKRSIAINLKSEAGREIAQRLIRSASVVMNNFRPGVAARLGLDEQTVRALNPHSVVLETSGYGSDGPNARRTGLDMIFQALCGHEIRAGGQGNPPLWFRAPIVDYTCGLLGSIGSLLALLRVRRGGGALVQTDLLGAGLYLMSDLVEHPDGQFIGVRALNGQQTGLHPAEAFYEARDGWIAIAARGDAMAWRLAQAFGLASQMGPIPAHWNAAEAGHIAAACRPHTVEELLARLQQADVWTVRCKRDGQTMLDESALDALVFRGHNAVHGNMRQLGALFRLSATTPSAPPVIPEHGEHTRAILEELGYSTAQIESLYAKGVVA